MASQGQRAYRDGSIIMDAAEAAMPQRMKRRTPRSRPLGPARLPGHRLDFTRYSTGFHGRGAREHGLPEDWVRHLECIRVV